MSGEDPLARRDGGIAGGIDQPQEPVLNQREPIAPANGKATTKTAKPAKPVNHSTVLGDGKSGTYTDGKGTYGGNATQGTGPAKP